MTATTDLLRPATPNLFIGRNEEETNLGPGAGSFTRSSIPVALGVCVAASPFRQRKIRTNPPLGAAPSPSHSCCPGVDPKFVPPVFVKLAPATVPCDQHPCSVKQTPQNTPPLPVATRIPRPASEGCAKTVFGGVVDGRNYRAAEIPAVIPSCAKDGVKGCCSKKTEKAAKNCCGDKLHS